MEKLIIKILKEAGAVHVGFLSREKARFGDWIQPWLSAGHHGDMKWMERNGEFRSDPCAILENGKSIISMAFPYLTPTPHRWKQTRLISNYAWGEDYHNVLRKKLKGALNEISQAVPAFEGRIFIDSAPLPEKMIAAACGIGWIGRNSLLISPNWGSYVFLAEIVCNLELTSTPPLEDQCGECQICIESCPNHAIGDNRSVDSRRCTSYLTIEKTGQFSKGESRRVGQYLFGCDKCQLVCPVNESVRELSKSPFSCDAKWLNLTVCELSELSESMYENLKIKSPLKRPKLDGIRRNARAILDNGPLPDNWD